MIDLFLRFSNQSDMFSVLDPLGLIYTDEEGVQHLSQGSHQYAAWEVGEVSGAEGWHLNLRVIDSEFDVSSLEPYRVYPVSPVCVWA